MMVWNLVWIAGAVMLLVFVAYTVLAFVIAAKMLKAQRVAPSAESLQGFETVRFHSRGDSVPLTASYAPAARPERAVVLVHGRGHCRGFEFAANSSSLVTHLQRRGFSVLLLDLRGHGESASARLTYGLRERLDVLGAVDWLLDHGFLPGQIGVIGASMGGVSAILAAADEPAIAAVVSDSAFAEVASLMSKWFAKVSGLPQLFLSGSLLAGRLLSGERVNRVRPVDAVARMQAKLLVIHALDDRFVPHSHAVALMRAAGAEGWFTPGQSHLASFREFPAAYAERVTGFLEQHLTVGAQVSVRSANAASRNVDRPLEFDLVRVG